MSPAPLVSLLCLAACASSIGAQTLYTLTPGDSSTSPRVIESGGPPDPGTCGYPDGLTLNSFPTDIPAPPGCPVAMWRPTLMPFEDDVAVDRLSDTIWAADPLVMAEYTPDGDFLQGFPLWTPIIATGVIRGLGRDSAEGTLWISGGIYLAEMRPLPGCDGQIENFYLTSTSLGLITDVDVDPQTGSLWICTEGGEIANLDASTGSILSGPVAVAASCGLGPLVGLAVDATTPGIFSPELVITVTDGTDVARISSTTGLPAPTTFYAPSTCFSVPDPVAGLAFAAHGTTFGTPSSTATISMEGQSVIGMTITVDLEGAPPGADVYLLLSFDFGQAPFYCPAPTIGFPPAPVYVDPALYGPVFLGNLGAATGLSLPVPIPPDDAIVGLPAFCQFVLDTTPGIPGGPYETTNGLEFTLSRP